jgi:uncharacterized protein YdbL (DUF1318 family)
MEEVEMKHRLRSVIVSLLACTAFLSFLLGCPNILGPQVTLPPTVVLGGQTGAITAGVAGSATYAVATTRIAAATVGEIEWFSDPAGTTPLGAAPSGISATVTAVASNAATVTISATAQAAAGSYYFKLSEGAAPSALPTVSAIAVLVISPAAPVPTIYLGAQSQALVSGIGGTTAFPVVTANLADGTPGTIIWYASAAGSTSVAIPSGISPMATNVSGNAAVVTVAVGSGVGAGSYFFALGAGTAVSAVATLVVSPAAPTPVVPTVVLGGQTGAISSGTAGSASYSVTTTNVADGVLGTIAWYADASATTPLPSAPNGLSGAVGAVSSNAAAATINATISAAAGSYYFKVAEGAAVSAMTTVVVSPAAPTPVVPTVVLGGQAGAITSGTAGSASYSVTTANVAAGVIGSVAWYGSASATTPLPSAPNGLSGAVGAVSSNAATATINATISAAAGSYYFKVTEDTAVSAMATLVVSPPAATPTLTLGAQAGTIIIGTQGQATYAVAATGIADGAPWSIAWFADAAGTTPVSKASFVTQAVSSLSSGSATLTMTVAANATPGSYFFKLTEGSTTSAMATLVIQAPAATVALGTQNGTVVYGAGATASFAVTTTNMDAGVSGGTVYWCNADGTGATTARPSAINSVGGTTGAGIPTAITIGSTPSGAVGTYYFKLLVGSAYSNVASFVISPVPATVFFSLSANGASSTVTTTALALYFDVALTTLTANDITVTGATKGSLSGSGTTWYLGISGISVGNGGTVTVALANNADYTFPPMGNPRTVTVYVAAAANEGSQASPVSLTANSNRAFKAGASGGGSDVSYYKFTTTSAGTYALDLYASGYTVSLYSDSIFSSAMTNSIDRTPMPWGAVFRGLAASTSYYLKLTCIAPSAFSATGRLVDPATISAAAENDGLSGPVALTLGSPFSGKVGSHSYSYASRYSFTTAAAGDYKVFVSAPTPTATSMMNIDVYSDSSYSTIVSAGNAVSSASGGTATLAGLAASTTYYVSLRNCSPNGNEAYTITASSAAPTPLPIANSWTSGTMDSSGAVWYVATVTPSQTYTLNLDTSFNGSGTKTCDAKVSAFQSDKSTSYFNGIYNIYSSGRSLTIAAGQTQVYIKVEPFSYGGTGTFALKLQ